MDFKNVFNKNDVICSDRFRNGRLMVVEDFKNSFFINNSEFSDCYGCVDLFMVNQSWSAHEFTGTGKPYNWRLATDEDYIREINKRLFIGKDLGSFGETVEVDDNHLWIQNDNDSIGLSHNQALELADFIYEKIGRS